MQILILALMIALTGCGPQLLLEDKPASKDRYLKSSTGTPVALHAATKVCPRSEGDFSYTLEFPLDPQLVPFKLTHRDPTEAMELLQSVDFAGKFRWKSGFRRTGNTVSVLSDRKIITHSTELKLCPGHSYQTYSYEDVALKILMALEAGHNSISKFLPKLSRIKLKVAPIIDYSSYQEKDGVNLHQRQILVNNAMYSPFESQIIFLPQGMDQWGLVPYNGVPLWDIPLIAVHEYGHHVFNEILQRTSLHDSNDSGPCFDNRESMPGDAKIQSGKRTVGQGLILSALNEGAADLIAHYALEPKLHNLEIMNCLRDNRQVDRPNWVNGTPKRLDRSTVRKFLSTKRKGIRDCMHQVDYQDDHILGANIANLFDQLFDVVKLDRAGRLKLVLAWLKKLAPNLSTYEKNPRKFLLFSVQEMVKLVHKQFPLQKQRLCQKLSQRAPELLELYPCLH